MAIINTPTEANASGEIQPIFDAIKGFVGFVPKPTQLIGTSPALLKNWWNYTQYFMRHPRFSFELLNHIRLLVAFQGEFPFCIEFNSARLKANTGLSKEGLTKLLHDPSKANLSENERAMLLFVLKAVREPEEVSSKDVQALRDLDWSDEHIFEAVYYGGWMMLLGLLFNTFDMHEKCG
ncbi:MAG: hypothetical protein GY847_05070 [Proteobacteria bacterium]|nr:hypothetical protein [Pseudomonadota bacterium]